MRDARSNLENERVMARTSNESSPPRTIATPEFASYSQDILRALSRSARDHGLLSFAYLLDMAAAEAARVIGEAPENN